MRLCMLSKPELNFYSLSDLTIKFLSLFFSAGDIDNNFLPSFETKGMLNQSSPELYIGLKFSRLSYF